MKFKKQIKDFKIRKKFKQIEVFQKVLRFLILCILDISYNLVFQIKLQSILIFKTNIKNFCIFSGRSRSVYRKFKISRILFRFLGNKGFILGLKKNS